MNTSRTIREMKALQKQKQKVKEEVEAKQEGDDASDSDDHFKQAQKEIANRKQKKHKSKKRKNKDNQEGFDPRRKFFEDEAEEGSDSEEGHSNNRILQKDQYYSKEQLQRKTKDMGQKLNEMQSRIEKKNQMRQDHHSQLVGSNRYDADGNLIKSSKLNRDQHDEQNEDDFEDDEVGYGTADDIQDDTYQDQAKLSQLPSTSDPKLWQVKVKRGMERIATMAILNKSVDYAIRGKPLEVLSATCADNVENYIFVEAFRKNSVLEAIAGLNFCLGKIEIISLDEMTKIYESQPNGSKQLPEPRNWVRIKSGIYDKDLGVVEKIINDDKIWVKLIPRIDPQMSKSNTFIKKGFIQRLPQRAFNPQLFKDAQKQSMNGPGNNKSFYQWKNMFFRKGLLYKIFSIKQIETEDAKPSLDERTQFFDIFEQNVSGKNQGDDSSEIDADETRTFYKSDMSTDFCEGDKIKVVEGELQGAMGIILRFENEQVVFKPSNLEGFTDNLGIEKTFVVKYFEQGDLVRLIDGKYRGETGMVTAIQDIKLQVKVKGVDAQQTSQHPIVKLDKSQRELRVNRNILRLKTDHDKDMQRLVEMGAKMGINSHAQGGDRTGSMYKVGELIIYNGNKTYGYIIQVQDDFVKILSDQGEISRVRLTEIDKNLAVDRKAITRDQVGNILSIDDVVKCVGTSNFKGKKGIIKNICKSCVFLWDPKDFAHSGGIFCENTRSLIILGTEFLQGDNSNSAIAGQNKIFRDKLVHKLVLIIKGQFKGQRGTVSKVNGQDALIELSTRTKKISIPKKDLIPLDGDEDVTSFRPAQNNAGGQSQYGPRGGFGGAGDRTMYGGQSVYGGGQTAQYDAGKTPMAFNTPMYQQNNGGQTPGQEPGWGAAGNTAPYQANTFGDQFAASGNPNNWGQENSQSQAQGFGQSGNWGQGGGYTPGGNSTVIKNEQASAW